MIEGEVEPISGQRTPWHYPARRYICIQEHQASPCWGTNYIADQVRSVSGGADGHPSSSRNSTQNILLYFTYSTVLYSTLFYSTLLYFTLVYSTLLYFTRLYFILFYSTLLYSTLLSFKLKFYRIQWP